MLNVLVQQTLAVPVIDWWCAFQKKYCAGQFFNCHSLRQCLHRRRWPLESLCSLTIMVRKKWVCVCASEAVAMHRKIIGFAGTVAGTLSLLIINSRGEKWSEKNRDVRLNFSNFHLTKWHHWPSFLSIYFAWWPSFQKLPSCRDNMSPIFFLDTFLPDLHSVTVCEHWPLMSIVTFWTDSKCKWW